MNLQYFPLVLIKHSFIVIFLLRYLLDMAMINAIDAQNKIKRGNTGADSTLVCKLDLSSLNLLIFPKQVIKRIEKIMIDHPDYKFKIDLLNNKLKKIETYKKFVINYPKKNKLSIIFEDDMLETLDKEYSPNTKTLTRIDFHTYTKTLTSIDFHIDRIWYKNLCTNRVSYEYRFNFYDAFNKPIYIVFRKVVDYLDTKGVRF